MTQQNLQNQQKSNLPDVRLSYPGQQVAVVDESQWQVLVDAIFPNAKTPGAIVLAAKYCQSRNLDVMKRPVHIVPMWSSAKGAMVETVWPGINELLTTAHRTGQFAGMDETVFGPMKTETFTYSEKDSSKKLEMTVSFPEWAQVTLYRLVQGVRCPFTSPKVYWKESYATRSKYTEAPNEMWENRSMGQLAKCALAAALRIAFPEEIGNEYAAEEMEGKEFSGNRFQFAEPVDAVSGQAAKAAEAAAAPDSKSKLDKMSKKKAAPAAAISPPTDKPIETPVPAAKQPEAVDAEFEELDRPLNPPKAAAADDLEIPAALDRREKKPAPAAAPAPAAKAEDDADWDFGTPPEDEDYMPKSDDLGSTDWMQGCTMHEGGAITPPRKGNAYDLHAFAKCWSEAVNRTTTLDALRKLFDANKPWFKNMEGGIDGFKKEEFAKLRELYGKRQAELKGA